jgi:hypothetical protein
VRARKLSALGVVVALFGALIVAAGANAGASSGYRAKTSVTLATWPDGLVGTVGSNKPGCAKHRGIKIFKQRGANRHPDRDKVVATTTARKRVRPHLYQWSLEKGTSGSFYAKARKRDGCRSGFSRTYAVQPRGDVPACPSREPICKFDTLHMVDFGTQFCRPFVRDTGKCLGNPDSGDWPWNTGSATFTWDEYLRGSNVRRVMYGSKTSDGSPGGQITGDVPDPDSHDYAINLATAPAWDRGVYWYTPGLEGVDAGDQGGPLRLDYVHNPDAPTEISIRGYLYRWNP